MCVFYLAMSKHEIGHYSIGKMTVALMSARQSFKCASQSNTGAATSCLSYFSCYISCSICIIEICTIPD